MIPAISLQLIMDLKKIMKGWIISPLIPTREFVANETYHPYWNPRVSYSLLSFTNLAWKKLPNHASPIEEYLSQTNPNSKYAAIYLKPPSTLVKSKKSSQYPLRMITISLTKEAYLAKVILHLARGFKPDPNNSRMHTTRYTSPRMGDAEMEYHRAIHEGHDSIMSFETREIQVVLPKEGRRRPSVKYDIKINITQEILVSQATQCIKAILEESYRVYAPHKIVVERWTQRDPFLPITLP